MNGIYTMTGQVYNYSGSRFNLAVRFNEGDYYPELLVFKTQIPPEIDLKTYRNKFSNVIFILIKMGGLEFHILTNRTNDMSIFDSNDKCLHKIPISAVEFLNGILSEFSIKQIILNTEYNTYSINLPIPLI